MQTAQGFKTAPNDEEDLISDNDRMVLALKRPIRGLDGELITELHLVEPTALQWLSSAKQGATDSAELTLIALVTKIPRPVLWKLAISDFAAATRFLSSFAAVSPAETGEN